MDVKKISNVPLRLMGVLAPSLQTLGGTHPASTLVEIVDACRWGDALES
jgi:hypothetical protein